MISKKKASGSSIIKRFVGNKNTVTILGILACVATLIIGYNMRVNVSTSPVTVPYAKQNLPTRTLITSDLVGKIKISSSYTETADNLIMNVQDVVGNYVSYKTSIPKNSLFYKEQIIKAEEMPDFIFSNIPDGYTVFSLDVDEKETFYNSVRAGDYVDLYVLGIGIMDTGEADDERVLYAPYIEAIKVLAVKDDAGEYILKNGLSNGSPSEILFAVKEEDYLLLMKSQLIEPKLPLKLYLHNDNYTRENGNNTDFKSRNDAITQYINDKCIDM